MSNEYIKISRKELAAELKRAFEAGWSGCLDLADSTAEKMVEDIAKRLSIVLEDDPALFHIAKLSHPSDQRVFVTSGWGDKIELSSEMEKKWKAQMKSHYYATPPKQMYVFSDWDGCSPQGPAGPQGWH